MRSGVRSFSAPPVKSATELSDPTEDFGISDLCGSYPCTRQSVHL